MKNKLLSLLSQLFHRCSPVPDFSVWPRQDRRQRARIVVALILTASLVWLAQAAAAAPGVPLAWGNGFQGQLGDGSFHQTFPYGGSVGVDVSGLTDVVSVSAGYGFSVALKSDGTVRAWGAGGNGQLGNGTLVASSVPVTVNNLNGVIAIAAGYSHGLALKADGTVWAWGQGGLGQMGNGTFINNNPNRVQVNLSGVVAIAAGGYHGLALKADGTVWTWGYNNFGQLGNGTLLDSATPAQVTGLSGVIRLAGGAYHTLALKADGTVRAWGYGGWGQLGNSSYANNNPLPIQVGGLTGVADIAGGFHHSLAVMLNGTVRAWGRGTEGQLGHGIYEYVNTPVTVSGLSGATAAAAGAFFSLGLKADGTVWGWGRGDYGALGDGIIYSAPPYGVNVPIQATTVVSASAIAAGYDHGLALPIANQPPVAQCHDVIVPANGACSANASIDSGSFDPDAGDSIVSATQNPAGPYPLGTTLVTLTVVDPHGSSASCQASVTVVDTTPPSVTCPAGTTMGANANCEAAIPNVLGGVAASDNCTAAASLVLIQNPAGGTMVSVGLHTITVTAQDGAGNTATCSTSFTVADTTPPSVTCPAGTTMGANANCEAAIPNVLGGVVASDNCTAAASLVWLQNPAAGTMVSVGIHTITVTAQDGAGNTATCSTTFTVADATPPIVTCPAGATVGANASCEAAIPDVLGGVVASDNCTAAASLALIQNPAAGTIVSVGIHTITVTAQDGAENTATCSTTFTVADTAPPTISCPPAITFFTASPTETSVTVTYAMPSVSDACGTVSVVCVPASGSTLAVGTTTVTCTATDAAGNAAPCSFTVVVQQPSANCETVQASADRSRVHFNQQGGSLFAYFRGNVQMTDGHLASDFRVATGGTAQGTLTVTVGGNVVYANNQIAFAVQDANNPTDNREKWSYNPSSTEKFLVRWKDDQEYDATRDPNLPSSAATGNKNLGRLETRFINADETRFRFNFKDATKPLTITVDGMVLLNLHANGTVTSPFPLWRYGKVVEVLFPDRLVPGNTIAWYADGDLSNNGGLPENFIYQHEATALGNATDTYFNAGGRFFIKVPLTGVSLASLPRTAQVEFQIGQPGVTTVGCGSFGVTSYSVTGANWKFNDGPDDCESED